MEKIKSPSQLSSNTATYGENNRLAKDSTTIIRENEEVINTFDEKNSKNAKFKLNSNGDELSPQQQEYFKDSKVRDEEGRLLVVYHGTNANFTAFDKVKLTENTIFYDDALLGFHFGDTKDFVKQFGDNIIEVYLNIKNPMDFRKLSNKNINDLANAFDVDVEMINEGMDDLEFDKITKNLLATDINSLNYLKSIGYDGFIFPIGNNYEIIALDSNQIKSIDNLNPTTNDDIRFKKNDAESTNEETKVSRFQDKSVPEWAMSEMVDEETQKKIESIKTFYVPETDKKAREYVDNTLKDLDKNYNTYIDNYINDIQNGRVMTKKDIAVEISLIQEIIKRKDYDNYFKLSTNLTLLGTELGQQVQAFSLLKKLTPKGELYVLEQWVKRHNSKDINKKKQLKIDETLRKELFNLDTKYKQATDEKTKNELKSKIDEISNKIKDDLANQLPVTFWDKLREWRYLSMLGNPKTHVRNFIGNTVMMPIRKLKNKIARIIENSAIKLGKMQVSERVHIGRKHIAQATIDFAKADAIEVIDRLAGGSKFNNQTDIYTRQKKFKFKPLEAFRKFNYSMLEKADMWALKKTYIETFSEYVTAKGYTITDLKTKPEILEEARIYAIEESQKATYREFSKFANYINKIKSENAIAGITLDALIPFAKTPINVLKTGFAYSPIGLLNSVTLNTKKLKAGEININQYIDGISKGLTGSMIMALGMVLAKLGILKARVSDDDKEDKYLTDLGRQDYALEIAGKSYTLDWIAPASMPLFVGVVFQETLEEDDFRMGNIEGMVGAVASTADPLTDLSMLSSLNSTLQTYQDNKVSGMAKQMVKNFLAQHFPTLGSQIAKVIDPVKRTTASTNNTGNGLNKELNQYVNYLKSKVPFLSMQLEPYINVWGEEVRDENVINRALENLSYPFWVSEFNISSTVDNELTSLYKISGNNEIYPPTPRSYYTVDGQRYDMTSEEYTQYKIDYGKFSYSQLNSLINSSYYKNLEIEQKEEAIKTIYNYARDFARKGKYYELYKTLGSNANNLAVYVLTINSIEADKDADGNTIPNSKKKKVFKYIDSLKGLTKIQKTVLYNFFGYTTKSQLK